MATPSEGAVSPDKSSTEIPMPAPKIKHDWYQTEAFVVINILIKNVKPEDMRVDLTEITLSVTVKLPTGSDYSLELDLAHPIVPSQCSHKVLSSKIEIKLKKADGIQWTKLEGDGTAQAVAPKMAGIEDGPSRYPTNTLKDWNQIEKEISKDLEETPEGEAALNSLFQKIYCEGSDEVRRAMNKSFQESGGTVLSTNWKDVHKEKVEIKPPDGMEWKKWDS